MKSFPLTLCTLLLLRGNEQVQGFRTQQEQYPRTPSGAALVGSASSDALGVALKAKRGSEMDVDETDDQSKATGLITGVATPDDIPDDDSELSDLKPSQITLGRESILFSQQPQTQKSNGILNTWRFCKQNLPYLVTGAEASSNVADDNPVGGIYNMVFVRLPTIAMGVVYTTNLVRGHPLIIDYGDGLLEVPFLLVYSVLAVILR